METLKLKRYEPLEKEIQSTILEYLERRKVFCWKEHSGGVLVGNAPNQRYMSMGIKGKSDILGITKEGKFLAIEVKRPSGTVSEDQQSFIDRINNAGGLAFVARSLEDVVTKGL